MQHFGRSVMIQGSRDFHKSLPHFQLKFINHKFNNHKLFNYKFNNHTFFNYKFFNYKFINQKFINQYKFIHQLKPNEIEVAKQWLEDFDSSKIPTSLFSITYSRSSGPGGQKVNKTSSKATVSMGAEAWLHPTYCYWIPPPIREQLAVSKIRYEMKNGGILIQSDTSRNREVNTSECFRKLLEEIKNKTFFEGEVSEEDVKKWDRVRELRKEARLQLKKKKSDKKNLRSKKFDW